jgi:tripartite-type tricarboxylate transporter receptor subunit TctC
LPHLVEAMLFAKAGLAWQHIAYAGGPPAVTQLLGGQIAALALPEGLLSRHLAAGRLRILATTGVARSVYLPEVPTFAEQGHADLVVTEWFAFFAPGGIAKAVAAERAASLQQAISHAAVATAYAQAGMVPVSSSPAALAARIATEQRDWQAVLRAHVIRAD